jgi:peptide/nickel transport system permease protein
VAFGVSVVTFFLTRLVLDDPGLISARAASGGLSPPAALVARFQREYGTDRPVLVQFAAWIGDLLRFDLGDSYQYKELSVAQLVGAGLGTTLLMALAAIVCASVIGLALGLAVAARRSRALDSAFRSAATLSLAAPQALVGLALILILSVQARLFPAGGWGTGYPDNFRYLALPVATLTIALAPLVFRITRERALEVQGEGHVEAARSRGLAAGRILTRHVLPNCAAPVITAVAMSLGGLISGAVIVEMVFGMPGIGHVLTAALGTSDYPVIQAMTLLTGMAIVVCNMVSEIANRALDPRMR